MVRSRGLGDLRAGVNLTPDLPGLGGFPLGLTRQTAA